MSWFWNGISSVLGIPDENSTDDEDVSSQMNPFPSSNQDPFSKPIFTSVSPKNPPLPTPNLGNEKIPKQENSETGVNMKKNDSVTEFLASLRLANSDENIIDFSKLSKKRNSIDIPPVKSSNSSLLRFSELAEQGIEAQYTVNCSNSRKSENESNTSGQDLPPQMTPDQPSSDSQPEFLSESLSHFMWDILGLSQNQSVSFHQTAPSPENESQPQNSLVTNLSSPQQNAPLGQASEKEVPKKSPKSIKARLKELSRKSSSSGLNEASELKKASKKTQMSNFITDNIEIQPVLNSWESLASSRRTFSFDEIRPPVVLVTVPNDVNPILKLELAAQLRDHLAPLQREAGKWHLKYNLKLHGISLNTLYANCQDEGAVLLLIEDANGNIFGAFLSEDMRVQPGYFGNGECFLFKLQDNKQVAVYHATGNNDYLILCEPHCIALGGGEGHFGLWIDAELFHGHSGPCQTFNNQPLSSTSEFEIVGIEIWSFEL